MSGYAEHQRLVAERCERVVQVAREAVRGKSWLLQPDWRDSLAAVLDELERIVERDAHPDDVDRARAGISALLGMFLTVEQVEAAYLGGESPETGYAGGPGSGA